MAVVNLGMGRIEAMLKILDVEGAVRRDGTRWQSGPGRGLELRRRALRAGHGAAPGRAAGDGGVRRRRALPDARAAGGARRSRAPQDCGRCSVCTAPRFARAAGPGAGRAGRPPPALDADRARGQEDGARRRRARCARSPRTCASSPGWALARFGDGGWWPAVERGLRGGRFEDEVVAALADAVARRRARSRARPRGLGHDRSRRSALGEPARRAGHAAGRRARRAVHCRCWRAPRQRPPQREMANAVQQAANVRGAFTVIGTPPPGHRRAARRSPQLGLDAGDGRRSAAPGRGRAGRPARARDRVLSQDRLIQAKGAARSSPRHALLRRRRPAGSPPRGRSPRRSPGRYLGRRVVESIRRPAR